MNTRSRSQTTETKKIVGDPIITSTRSQAPYSGDSDTGAVSTSKQEMAEPESRNDDILSKLLEGQRQAKLTSQKNSDDIKKQFTDMKELITTNSTNFDQYVRTNDAKIAKVDASVDSMNKQILDLQTQLKALHSQAKSVEDGLDIVNERVDNAEKEMGEAANDFDYKAKLFL